MLRENEVRSLLSRLSATVGTPVMEEIDREMTPILAELLTLGPGNNKHPAVKQLFNWLVDPQRSGEDFRYAIGPLHRHVSGIMDEHFAQYVYEGDSYFCEYLGKVAVEALAVKCPVLEGPWEQAAWLLIMENSAYDRDEYGVASDLLTDWVIHAIGDPDLCPNPYLRMKLMVLLHFMVDLKDHHRTQTFEAVLSACSSFDLDYLLEDGHFHEMGFDNIIQTLYLLVDYDDKDAVMEFDRKLAEKLLDVKTLRLSAIVHDVAYNCAVNTKKYEQPMALHGLTALLNTIAGCAQQVRRQLHNISNLYSTIEETIDLMCLLINHFKESCRTPQLVGLTASCITDVKEMMMSVRAVDPMYRRNFREKLADIDFLFGEFSVYKKMMTMGFLYDDDIGDNVGDNDEDNGEEEDDEDDGEGENNNGEDEDDDGDGSDDDYDVYEHYYDNLDVNGCPIN